MKETDKDRSLAHKATVSISPRISPGRRLSLNKSSHANEGPERGSGCASFRTCIAVRSNAFLQTLMKLFLKNLISAETDAIGVDGNMFVFKKLHIRVAELLTPSDGLDVVAPAFLTCFIVSFLFTSAQSWNKS